MRLHQSYLGRLRNSLAKVPRRCVQVGVRMAFAFVGELVGMGSAVWFERLIRAFGKEAQKTC